MSSAQDYSQLDRILHNVAFKGISAQKALSDIEDRLFLADQLKGLNVERPVFVTSLPRAGTTLLLEVLAVMPELATHTYRHMPFILCPLLWDRISRGIRKESKLSERAHGDGMQVGYDSPEAFEEILWKAFWPDKYLRDRIRLWTLQDCNEEFEAFFRNHMRKITALRSGGHRYLSKNNANIARLELIPRILPDCKIVVPVRNPLSHSESMLRQHVRFNDIHVKEKFSHRYMDWLGHYEFGALLRPIDFEHWIDKNIPLTPDTRNFWLTYWITAYSYILSHATENVIFVDYDRLCLDPLPGLKALAMSLELKDNTVLLDQASRFRAPTHYEIPHDSQSDELADRASEIYNALLVRSLQQIAD